MFPLSWNLVPSYLEQCSISTGTGFQLTWNTSPDDVDHAKKNYIALQGLRPCLLLFLFLPLHCCDAVSLNHIKSRLYVRHCLRENSLLNPMTGLFHKGQQKECVCHKMATEVPEAVRCLVCEPFSRRVLSHAISSLAFNVRRRR